MSDVYIHVKDVNGNLVTLNKDAAMSVMQDGTIYGLTLSGIQELINLYYMLNGKKPITVKSIRELADAYI